MSPAPHRDGQKHTMTACAPCVARPLPLPQRVAAIQAAIVAEAEPLITLTHLLLLCRDEHPVLWERVNDPGCRTQVELIVADVLPVLAAASTVPVLDLQVRGALAAALTAAEDLPAVVVAHALAELLDERYGHSFAESFRRRSPYQPGVGDPIPLDSPDLPLVTTLPATSPSWRLANRLDETRHIRLAGEWTTQFQVIFDYSLADALTGLVGPDTVIATCHPNRTLAEFEFPVDALGRTFPVRPADEQRQHDEIDRLTSAAVTAGASIVVLPELCVTESLAARLQDWTCRADGPRLLVAGSYHHDDAHPGTDPDGRDGPPRRRNTAIAYLRGCPAPLTQDKHSPADMPLNEDIQPQGWPQLRVHVSADGWHLVIAICRDLLNPHAVHALTEAGVNMVLVPAMSETLVAFGGPVANLVGAGQAFVAVANNPANFSATTELTSRRPARALFGHPGFGQQTRLVQPADSAPGVALLRIRTGQLQWLEPGAPVPQAFGNESSALPAWATRLARLTGPARFHLDRQPVQITLRSAAALVLLTDSPEGPAVLLTERAPDLIHYPGQLVFPGGATETSDDGPASTALREAYEETGLDPASVHILGTLPAVALADSGFLLTPVLAWSARPAFTGPANLAEVSALTSIPLRQAAGGEPPERPFRSPLGAPKNSGPKTLGAVTALVTDLLAGMLHVGNPGATTTVDGPQQVQP
ncbi:NUDIX domain-containing protein [Arthrobacter sp. H14-L1]|uniref:NUDIX domain-containing protein n=1 Tax=Arthrobacter sp. H14-L1 TaxID=2996697 RepID=UPI00226F920E|nr:NUDIX domain-containing protein [Arthrobacter sp. H14-L1]MCY0906406.1 NUDIX domain-containing protein [Arthrobacter sp. H14-L1]